MASGYEVLIADLNRIINNDRVYIAAINSVLVAQKERIFDKGLSVSGRIGEYSTKPISIARNKQARNTGQTYFKGGYRQYKSLIGRDPKTVNLRNTDQMMMDLGTTVVRPGEYGIGFTNQFNADKSEWMEDKYDKDIFGTTPEEDNLFVRVVEFEIAKI